MPVVEVGSNIAGVYLGDRRFWPFWEAAQDLDILVFVHPNEPHNIGAERLRAYYLVNLLGNPCETARCIADIVFAGVLEAYPRLKILLAHGGGAQPYISGRLEHGHRVRAEPGARIERPPSEHIARLYFDTVTYSETALELLVRTVGADHVLAGSDYPFDMELDEPVRFGRRRADHGGGEAPDARRERAQAAQARGRVTAAARARPSRHQARSVT